MPTLPGDFTLAAGGLGKFYELAQCAKYHGVNPVEFSKMSAGEQEYLFALYVAEMQKAGVNAFDEYIKSEERKRSQPTRRR